MSLQKLIDKYDRTSLRYAGRRLLKAAMKLPKHKRARQIDIVIANFCDVLSYSEINQILTPNVVKFTDQAKRDKENKDV